MAIKSIELIDIMSHHHTLYTFPETGIISISGENSDGKSVLTRAVYDTLISPSLHMKRSRKKLINNNCTCATVKYEFYDKPSLTVYIDMEKSASYYLDAETNVKVFVSENVDYIKRYVAKFYMNDLNIYRSLQPLIFGTTTERENYDALCFGCRDFVIEEAVEQFEANEKEFRQVIKTIEDEKTKVEAYDSGLKQYNLNAEIQFTQEATDFINILEPIVDSPRLKLLNLKSFIAPEIVDLEIPSIERLSVPKERPKVRVFKTGYPVINPVKAPKLLQEPFTFVTGLNIRKMDYSHVLQADTEVQSLLQSTCPTCGRRILEGEEEVHVNHNRQDD